MGNPSTLSNFEKYVNAQDVANLMKQFCQDYPNAGNPQFPCLGITDHGPAFRGTSDVNSFFAQLFKSFPKMQWIWPPVSAPGAPQLASADGYTIGVQMDVTGQYQKAWFPHGVRHYSMPLSQLADDANGGALGRVAGDHNGLPAFAVFSFDNSSLICQLQIYLDRYAMMQSIGLSWHP